MKNFKKWMITLIILISVVSLAILGGATLHEAWSHTNCCHYDYYHNDCSEYTIEDIRQMLGTQPYQYVRVHTKYEGVKTYKLPLEEYLEESYGMTVESFSNPYEVTTIRHSGKSNADSIVIVLMGDGFTRHEQGAFLAYAKSAIDHMLQTRPFNYFYSLFTVFAVQTISEESGVSRHDITPHIIVNNRFGAFIPGFSSIRLNTTFLPLIRNLAGNAASGLENVNMIQVIINTTLFGGRTYVSSHLTNHVLGIAFTTIEPTRWHTIFLHEFGHSFGGLADEHTNPLRQETANLTAEPVDANVRWSHWVGHGGGGNANRNIGVFRAGHAPMGYAIPSQINYCKMSRIFADPRPFCAVCSAELVRRMAHLAGETFYSRHPNPNQNHSPNYTTVSVSARATRILPYAFHGNQALQTLLIPSNIATIGRYAFLGATGLQTIINLNSTPQPIDHTAFAGTGVYTINRANIQLVIPQGTTAAYIQAGWGGFNIFELSTTVSGGTVTINGLNRSDFQDTLILPATINNLSVTHIAPNAFANQAGLTNVIFKNCSFPVFGANAFPLNTVKTLAEHDWRWEVTTAATETTDGVETRACRRLGCYYYETRVAHATGTAGLHYMLINNGTEYAVMPGGTATSGEIFIPAYRNGLPVVRIQSHAFSGLTGITSVFISRNIRDIWASAFMNCTSLSEVTFASGSLLEMIGNHSFMNTAIMEIVFPASVTSIGSSAFSGITPLRSIEFEPNSRIETIGNHAFSGAVYLLTIRMTNPEPPHINSATFVGVTRSLITLHVPRGRMVAYIAASWDGFIVPPEWVPVHKSYFYELGSWHAWTFEVWQERVKVRIEEVGGLYSYAILYAGDNYWLENGFFVEFCGYSVGFLGNLWSSITLYHWMNPLLPLPTVWTRIVCWNLQGSGHWYFAVGDAGYVKLTFDCSCYVCYNRDAVFIFELEPGISIEFCFFYFYDCDIFSNSFLSIYYCGEVLEIIFWITDGFYFRAYVMLL